MNEKKEDRRVLKTKQLLKDALLALIQEKGFEALTVQDILDRANVGRSTFYTHFQGKEDLILQGLDSLQTALHDLQRRERHGTGAAFSFRHALFAHVDEQRGVFRAMIGRTSGLMVQRRFQQMLTDLVREDLHALALGKDPGAAELEALAQFIAGGMYGMLNGWMDGRMRMTAQQMSDQFQRFALSVVGEALPR